MLHSHPPAPDCGAMSHRTAALRPDLGLSEELTAAIRRERRKGEEPAQIAATLSLPLSVVERALLAMRTPKDDRSRATLNVTLAAAEFVRGQAQEGEAIHEVVDWLLRELESHRTPAAVS